MFHKYTFIVIFDKITIMGFIIVSITIEFSAIWEITKFSFSVLLSRFPYPLAYIFHFDGNSIENIGVETFNLVLLVNI